MSKKVWPSPNNFIMWSRICWREARVRRREGRYVAYLGHVWWSIRDWWNAKRDMNMTDWVQWRPWTYPSNFTNHPWHLGGTERDNP